MGIDWASGEIVGVLTFLLPGFVAAAVFYALTSHPRPGTFDRIVLALIFTVIVQTVTRYFLLILAHAEGDAGAVETWEPALSILIAVVLGLLASYFSNTDSLHKILRRSGITKETSYPSEWYSAFSRHRDSYVVLHMDGRRRLLGWPEEWPSRPEEGHFRLAEAEWLYDDRREPIEGVATIPIPVGEVEMVEFLNGQQR